MYSTYIASRNSYKGGKNPSHASNGTAGDCQFKCYAFLEICKPSIIVSFCAILDCAVGQAATDSHT